MEPSPSKVHPSHPLCSSHLSFLSSLLILFYFLSFLISHFSLFSLSSPLAPSLLPSHLLTTFTTVARSDVFGQILPIMGKDWSHSGVVQLYSNIKENNYHILYLTARAIGQVSTPSLSPVSFLLSFSFLPSLSPSLLSSVSVSSSYAIAVPFCLPTSLPCCTGQHHARIH